MAARNRTAIQHDYVTFHVRLDKRGRPRKNLDGSQSILTLVRVPKQNRISKTFKSQKDAEAWAYPLAQELAKQIEHGAQLEMSSMTIGGLVRHYLDEPDTKAQRSFDSTCERANWWALNYAPMKVIDFGVGMLREGRGKLLAKGRAPATVNRYLSVMRSMWNWGKAAGFISMERNWPTKLLLPEPAGRIRFLNPDELAALLGAAEPDPLLRAAILVSLATGLRQGELLKLKWSDVNFARSSVTTYVTKNKTPRQVHIGSEGLAALQTLRDAKVVSPVSVFIIENGKPLKKSALQSRWRKIRAAAALADFHWHDLRHTCASILAQNGATLLEIGSVLGHKSPSMTMRYAHLIQGAPVKGHAALDAMLKGGH